MTTFKVVAAGIVWQEIKVDREADLSQGLEDALTDFDALRQELKQEYSGRTIYLQVRKDCISITLKAETITEVYDDFENDCYIAG